MTDYADNTTNTATESGSDRLDAAVEAFMADYRPTGLPEEVWLGVQAEVIALIRRAGAPTRGRVEKDLQLVASVLAHLRSRGRPVTVGEVVADVTLADYDGALTRAGASEKTRENRRGILRRLQAVHHGAPWRAQRRPDGTRAANLHGPDAVDVVTGLLTRAQVAGSGDAGAVAFASAVAAARTSRRTPGSGVRGIGTDRATWRTARAWTQGQGTHLTADLVAAAALHELLAEAVPVAVLARRHGLTRRDLDQAVTHLPGLPDTPAPEHVAALRGT